jgi:hypothetical protein
MKILAMIAATGSLAAFAAPAFAAEPPAAPASTFATFHDAGSPFASAAAYGRDDRREWRGRGRDRDWDRDRRIGRNDRVWRGRDGRYHCRRNDGTTGLVIGAGAGALLGRELDGRGDRALGTILGAVGGGLLGREVERRSARCR